ncbi:phage portal protein [Kordiimonas sp.]|uniref:phage portal protein n=1 Tax=Kordiimonas sp. TaxID=1970157 RepID=UPI003A8F6121
MSFFNSQLAEARGRTDNFASAVKAMSVGESIAASTQLSGLAGSASSMNRYRTYKQYKAYRERAYAAIRPLVARIARQGFRVGIEPKRGRNTSSEMMTKCLGRQLGLNLAASSDANESRLFVKGSERKFARNHAPEHIKKSFDTRGLEVLNWHPFNDWIDSPNSYMQRNHLIGSLAASNFLTGFSLTFVELAGKQLGSGMMDLTDTRPTFSYFPSHWCEPVHSPGPFSKWAVRPRQGGESHTIDSSELIYCYMEDPEDPLGVLAPLQANSLAVATSGKIADAHYHSLENMIRPGYAIIAGDLPMPGGGSQQMTMTPDQRNQLVAAVKAVHAGVYKHGEPIIFDALVKSIEDISKTPKDLDFQNGEEISSSHIREGVGTNEVVSGQVQNANRAGATVAHEVVFDMTVNPQIQLIGSAFDKFFSPLLSTEEYTVKIWLEEAVANDSEMRARRAQVFGDDMTGRERRHYLATGEIDLDPEVEGSDTLRGDEKRQAAEANARRAAGAV